MMPPAEEHDEALEAEKRPSERAPSVNGGVDHRDNQAEQAANQRIRARGLVLADGTSVLACGVAA